MKIVQHYKGAYYRVIAFATHTETNEPMVVYQNDHGETFVRPSGMFYDVVEVDGQPVDRFKTVFAGAPE